MSLSNIGLVPTVGALLLATGVGHGAVIRVPEDQPSILVAVDAAVSGDSVLVGPGTWTDRDTRRVQVGPNHLDITSAGFLKPGISVVGVEGPAATIVDAGPATVASVVTFLHTQPGGEVTHLQGLTITGGGNGVHVVGAVGMEIADCEVLSNVRYGVSYSNTDLWMRECLVKGNVTSKVYAAAMEGDDGANLEMVNCRIEANVRGALRHAAGGSQWVVIEACEFLDHTADGAVQVSQVSNLQISNTKFARNYVGGPVTGGGLSVIQCAGVVEFCVFESDSAQESAGALYVKNSEMRVENNTFYACYAGFDAASVLLGTGFSGTFARNVVAGSTGGHALRTVEPLGSSSGCNVIWDNEGGDFDGEWNPGLPEIFADPQFCAPDNSDFTVHGSSPCVAENSDGCGDIGAFGIGCGSVSIENCSWGRIKGSYR